MNCEAYQLMTSRLVDGEVPEEESGALFEHLASCAGCRRFFHQAQSLGSSLARLAHPPAGSDLPSVRPFQVGHIVPQEKLWRRSVSLRLPVLALAAGLFAVALLYGAVRAGEVERVYVTQMPEVIVAADRASTNRIN